MFYTFKIKHTCKIIVPSYELLGFNVIGVTTMPASTHIMFGYSSSPKSLIVLDVTSQGFHTTKNNNMVFNNVSTYIITNK